MPSAYKLLQLALAVVGVVALLLYPLALIWPSGWTWESCQRRPKIDPFTTVEN